MTITVDEGYEGPLTVTLPKNAVDEGNEKRFLSFTVDQTAPTPTLVVPSSFRRPIAGFFSATLTFNEPVKLGEDSDTGAVAAIRLHESDFTLTSGSMTSFSEDPDDDKRSRVRGDGQLRGGGRNSPCVPFAASHFGIIDAARGGWAPS